MVSKITRFEAPTEVDHYQIRRTLDIYVRPHGEDLGRIADGIPRLIAKTKMPQGIEAHPARLGGGHARVAQEFLAWACRCRLMLLY